ncbi:MAG: hypothetical protein PVG25_08005 [Anaerolineae bacterium]|jgi:hypothetical protein
MKAGTLAVVALSVFLVAWYIGGSLYNRRRGLRVRRWLAGGLDVLGGEREEGWLGSPSTGARINVRRAQPPFRRLEITFLLANREIPFLWLLDHLRGRQDRIIIRATLRSPRRGEVKVRSNGQTKDQAESWTWQERPDGLSTGYGGHDGARLVRALDPWLEAYGAHLSQFDWRKQDPHIHLQLGVSGLLEESAKAVLSDLGTALSVGEQV